MNTLAGWSEVIRLSGEQARDREKQREQAAAELVSSIIEGKANGLKKIASLIDRFEARDIQLHEMIEGMRAVIRRTLKGEN